MSKANESTVQVYRSGQHIVTIPKAIAQARGWKDKTKLEWLHNDRGEIVVREAR